MQCVRQTHFSVAVWEFLYGWLDYSNLSRNIFGNVLKNVEKECTRGIGCRIDSLNYRHTFQYERERFWNVVGHISAHYPC